MIIRKVAGYYMIINIRFTLDGVNKCSEYAHISFYSNTLLLFLPVEIFGTWPIILSSSGSVLINSLRSSYVSNPIPLNLSLPSFCHYRGSYLNCNPWLHKYTVSLYLLKDQELLRKIFPDENYITILFFFRNIICHPKIFITF